MRKIIIYVETQDGKFNSVSYELISKAFSLKQKALELKESDNDFKIEALAIAPFLDSASIADAYCAGADRVVLLKNEKLDSINFDVYSDIFVRYYSENPAEIVIFPATLSGRMLAPKITTLLDTGLVADCTELDLILDKKDEIKLAPTRPTFGAELMATILSKKNPQCATIRPGIFKAEFIRNTDGEYFEQEIESFQIPKKKLLRSYKEKNEDKIDFSNSKIIFTAGAGLCSKDNIHFKKLKEVAKRLNVDYAVTRKVVDLGIERQDFQIGQTGSTVSSELYVAFGVSGAIQHISGMKNSKTIVSINTDNEAEIFKYSDYKIVTDAKKVIDEMYDSVCN